MNKQTMINKNSNSTSNSKVLILALFMCVVPVFSYYIPYDMDENTDNVNKEMLYNQIVEENARAVAIKHSIRYAMEHNITECKLCELIVDLIEDEVKRGNKTFHDIVDLIEDLCRLIGGPIVAKECDLFLSELSKVEKLIVDGYNSTYICRDIHMCSEAQIRKSVKYSDRRYSNEM